MRESGTDEETDEPGGLRRAVKGAVLVFLFLMVALAIVSWLGGDSSTLPLDYDGFD
jgi:hypothetical protein